MLRRITALLLLLVLSICPALNISAGDIKTDTFATLATPALSAESAVLINALDNSVICEKNANAIMAMASTTKIMTALVAVEACDIGKTVSVSPKAVGVEGSSVYLFAGEKMTLEDLLYAMLLESANDAAAAIAIEVGKSIEGFADMMNQKAKELGLCNTNFKNPHGLYDEEHYTTASELAIIASEALKNETLRKIFSTKKHTITAIDGNTRVLYNHNKMLSLYDGAIGVKTGFTKKSGRCLVSAAERDGLLLVCVTLNAPSDWNDHKALLDLGFESFETRTLYEAGKFKHMLGVTGGKESYLMLSNTERICLTLPKGSFDDIKICVELFNRFEIAPVKIGKNAGEVVVYYQGRRIASSPLVFATGTERLEQKLGFFDRIKNIFS